MTGLSIETVLIYVTGTLTTLLVGSGATLIGLKKGWRAPRWLYILILALPAFFLAAQLLKLYSLKDYADFAVWNEIVLNITRGEGPFSSLQEGLAPGTGHWFSAHFTPLIYLFALAYRLIPRPETLLAMQFLLLISAVPLLYLYARRALSSRQQALIAACALILHPTYQYIHLYEFEMLRFSIPLLLATFIALEAGKSWAYWPCLGLSLLVREEVAITAFFLGLYALIFMKERRFTGLATAALSMVYFLLVTQWIMPSFRAGPATEHVAATWFASLGTTLPEVVKGIFTKPAVVLALVSDPVKLANLFLYLLPLLFLPLRAWPVLLITAGNVGLNLLSGSGTHSSYFLYYLAPSIPFIFIALVQGLRKLGEWLDSRSWTRSRSSGPPRGAAALSSGLLAASLTANFFFGPSPLSLEFWLEDYKLAPFRTLNFHYRHYAVDEHHRLAKEAAAAVPPEAVVSAEQALLPRFHDRKGLRIFPDLTGATHVAIDKKNPLKTGTANVPGSWDGLRQDPQSYYDWVEKDPRHWDTIFNEDGYFVYKRKSGNP